MSWYRVEITETRRYYVEIKSLTSQEAITGAVAGQGEISEPYPPEIDAIKVIELECEQP